MIMLVINSEIQRTQMRATCTAKTDTTPLPYDVTPNASFPDNGEKSKPR